MFKRSIFQRVGGQLVQGKTERLNKFEVQGDRRTCYPYLIAPGSPGFAIVTVTHLSPERESL
jgi:hypothetical protein